jgi:tetratricopeptide (TPR) repeat protein
MAFESAGAGTTLSDDPESRALTAQTLQSCIDSGDQESVCRIGEAMQRDYPDDIATWGPALIHAYLDVAKPRYEKGIPVCKSMVDRASDPKTVVDALTVLAECMYPLGRGAEAVAYQDDYYRQHPDRNMDADWVRARTAYYAEKDWAKAARLLDAFISAYPKSDLVNTCREMLGDSLALSGQTERAKQAYAEAIAGAPDKTVAAKCAYKRAYASYYAQDWAVGRDAFQGVLDTYPGSDYEAGALYLVGECSARLGDAVTARTALEGVVSRFPDSAMAKMASRRLSTLPTDGSPGGAK